MTQKVVKIDQHLVPAFSEEFFSFFSRNYPQCHDFNEREEDFRMRSTINDLRILLRDRTILLLIDEDEKIVGLLEFMEKSVHGAIYGVLNWIMVDVAKRGRGFARILHDIFEVDVKNKYDLAPDIPVAQLLSVHQDNPAQAIYKKWGYENHSTLPTPPGKTYMMKIVL